MTPNTTLARHRAKQKKAGITRFSVQIDSKAVSLLRSLCQKHSKTQGEFLALAIMAADGLLAGRLQIAKTATKPPARAIIRSGPQKRRQTPDPVSGNTDTPARPENTPTTQQCKPAQAINDADARIRAAAFVVEP